ncbi:ammonium transporter [Granulicella cerasi]|uniref:ammonium transporter n=1 Tax=Granulicella cerasi TaxID=741063 RepID=UPI0037C0A254
MRVSAVGALLLTAGSAWAQTAATASTERIAALEKANTANATAIASAQSAGDNAWMLVSAALVLMMSGPGLALFYGGLVRKKNILATMMQTFAMMAIITVLWALFGYSLAFAPGHGALAPYIGGFQNVFLHGVGTDPGPYAATIPSQTFMVYQLMFAIITPALITGAFAERMKFSAMVVFLILWAILVYSPMAHMVWGVGGLLNTTGGKFPCLDFAGGTVVHVTSGVSALVTALYIGKRVGYPQKPMPPHSVVLSFIGACLLWVGWFGFNAGSALAASGLATSAFVATHFAAAAAACGWLAAEWIRNGKPSALGGISGAVAGLVGITPAAGFVTPMAALWIGLITGVFCFYMVVKVKNIFGYDDSLDAFGVHGSGGTLGAILTGLFARAFVNKGTNIDGFFAGNHKQLLNQFIGVAIAWVISIVGTLIILFVVDKLIGLRVSEEDEREGLDITQHGEEGYDWDVA